MPDTLTAASVRLSALPRRTPTALDYRPDRAALDTLRDDLGVDALRKVRLFGTLSPLARADWALDAQCGATVVQPCVVSGEPVTTRIDVPVVRLWTESFEEPVDAETEMPEDDTVEPLPKSLDLLTLVRETLALALPDYPRSPDAAFDGHDTAPPDWDAAPEAENPFAALAPLRSPKED